MKNKILLVMGIMLSLFILSGCSKSENTSSMTAYTSVYPVEYILENLYGENIAIYSIYPHYELSQNECDELIELLSNIVIFEKDTTWGKEPYVGVYCEMFYIEYTNGQTIDISGSPPFFFINDVAYKTNYDPCHKVSDFYWDIVNTKIRPLEQ